MSDFLKPAVAVIIPNLGGIAGSFLTRQNIPTWYEHLNRPSWRPPNYIFGPVWTYLYSSMGYASYLVWRDAADCDEAKLPLSLFAGQLALNWAWTPIFFGAHKLGLATIEIGVLWGAIVATMYTFYPINKTASLLLLPYLGWVSFASALTYSIWKRNKDRTD
ncbi:translocator protein-like [Liolophura sinensis]|uniref:translocator protein-like n=1 Tax=Liolophura sinensis TaxID=3198878 RepID=UPI00315919C7